MNRHDLWKAIYGGKPRMHATGFAQLYLAEGVRLYAWSDELFAAAPDVAQVGFFHDHRYGIKSQVLLGSLLDSPCQFISGSIGNWDIYEVRPAHEGEPEVPHLTSEQGYADLEPPRIIKGGDGYVIDKRSFHATRALEPTLTVMRKLDEEPAWARLLVPRHVDPLQRKLFSPVHSLIRQPTDGEMKVMMWNVASAIDDTGLAKIEEMIGEAYRAH